PRVRGRIGSAAAQLGDEGREIERTATPDPHRLTYLDTQFAQKPRRRLAILVLAVDGRDDQSLTSTRDRDIEQPAFLREYGGRRKRFGQSAATDAVRFQERPAPPQVRPQSLLYAGDHDETPLQAL